MHVARVLATWVAAAALCACAAMPVELPRHPSSAQPLLLLISIDGYRADYLDRGLSPNLAALAAQGVRARWMIPSFPTMTFPNHYTFLTGLYPDHHGIVGNTMWDDRIQPEDFRIGMPLTIENPRWWSRATPLWLSAQRAGIRTAEIAWPAGFVRIDGTRPDLNRNFRHARTPEQETRAVIRWLRLSSARRPRFIMVHYEAVDHAGHVFGPDSSEVDRALGNVDEALGALIAALKEHGLYAYTDLVVVSDHGMAAVSPTRRIYLDDLIDLDAARVVSLGAGAEVTPFPTPAGKRATAALLAPHPHLRCWRKHDLPMHLHYGRNPRIPAIVCLATPGWLVTTHAAAHTRWARWRGTHGYDNRAPSMRAIFVAEGPSFQRGVTVSPFANVDVYGLLAHILGVSPEKNDGDFARMQPMLAPADR